MFFLHLTKVAIYPVRQFQPQVAALRFDVVLCPVLKWHFQLTGERGITDQETLNCTLFF